MNDGSEESANLSFANGAVLALLMAAAASGRCGQEPQSPAASAAAPSVEVGRYQVTHIAAFECGFLKVDTVTGRAWCRSVDPDLGPFWYPLVPDERTLKDGAYKKP
jgi:hypothetical protein